AQVAGPGAFLARAVRPGGTPMSTPTLTCPGCKALLRADRPIPPGATLRCPCCKTTFPAREIDPDPAPPAAKVFGAPFVLAVTLPLGGPLIATAALLGRPSRPDPVASEAEQLDEDRRGPEAERAEVERREQKLGLPWGEAPLAAAGKVAEDEGEGPAEGKGAP